MTDNEYWEKRAKLSEAIYESYREGRSKATRDAIASKMKETAQKTFSDPVKPILAEFTYSQLNDDAKLIRALVQLGIKYDYSLTMMDATAPFADNIRITNALKVGKAVFYFDMGKYVGIG